MAETSGRVSDADDPWAITARYRDGFTRGSHVTLSAFTWNNAPAGMAGAVEVFPNNQAPCCLRTREEIVRMFGHLP